MPEPETQPTAVKEVSNAQPAASVPAQASTAAVQPTAEGGQTADLLSRVAAFKPSEAPAVKTEDPLFDINEISKIQDPKAKEVAEKAYKSFERGFQKKFQELAEIRKQFEAKQSESSNWTPEKVQNLLNDPAFVQSAQAVAGINPSAKQGGLADNEWSALTPQEQAKINEMQSQLRNLQQLNFQAIKAQEDAQLKSKFANYNAQAVDVITNDLLQGKVQATREHLFKVLDYDDAVKRAYELGRQDAQAKTQEKINSMSFTAGNGTQVNSSGITPDKGESNTSFWNKIIMKNLAISAGKK